MAGWQHCSGWGFCLTISAQLMMVDRVWEPGIISMLMPIIAADCTSFVLLQHVLLQHKCLLCSLARFS